MASPATERVEGARTPRRYPASTVRFGSLSFSCVTQRVQICRYGRVTFCARCRCGLQSLRADCAVDEELVRKAVLLQLSGSDTDEKMVHLLGIDPSEVDAVRQAAWPWSRKVGREVLDDSSTLVDRSNTREEAAEALSGDWWLTVEEEDPDEWSDVEAPPSFYVFYDDNIAHNFEASVDASVEAVRRFPGVVDTRHDRGRERQGVP